MSPRTKAQELQQQMAAENAEKLVELEEAGAFIFFIGFDLELRSVTGARSFATTLRGELPVKGNPWFE